MDKAFVFGLIVSAAALCSSSSIGEENPSPAVCSYEEAIWNVRAGKVIEVRSVSHPYSQLTDEEIDRETGCTVCSEDQVDVELPSMYDLRLCRKIAPQVRDALLRLIESGATVSDIRGYEVIRSRGGMDAGGNRMMFSNHSFGTALDINRESNGLYDNCIEFGPECRLVLGGRWRPGAPGSHTPDGPVVRAMKELGFQWGGEIKGRQKDFMHFSYTGY